MRSLLPLLSAMAVAGAAACGQESIDFAPLVGIVDAGRDLNAPETTGAPDAALECAPPGSASECASNGAACTQSASCCSSRCESETCLPSGACTAPGSPCSVRSTCCSGRCEPEGSHLVCLAYCAVDGAHCDRPSDCCSLACHGSLCGGTICAVAGTSCSQDPDCCSGSCVDGACALDSSLTCRGSGEGCTGGDAGIGCCSGVCNATTGRCDPGPGACREPDSPCAVTADCCRGQCLPGPGGVPVCTATCLPDGADCNSSGDCCGGTCAGSPSRCASAPSCGG